MVFYYESGEVKDEWWDRTGEPFHIEYYLTGQVKLIEWKRDGVRAIEYFESGTKKVEWWKEPSYFEYSETGEITRIDRSYDVTEDKGYYYS